MAEKLIDLDSLRPLFQPRSIAILGASTDPLKIGGRPVAELLAKGYDGAIYPVNPNAETLQGLTVYANVKDIPGAVDLAICAVPGALAPRALDDCIEKGVGGVIMFTSGFAEIGGDGPAQQAAMAARAREGGIRLMGPNCMGIVNFRTNAVATFHPVFANPIHPGPIGLVSQSGAFGGLSYTLAMERRQSFSYMLTTGNEADVDVADCLAFLAQDPDTRVILLYMEGCRDGAKFIEALELARSNRKPVVAIKLGRTPAGAAAAASHTAALAGEDRVIDAIFRQYGVYRAHSIEEFFSIGCAVAVSALPKNDRIGMLTVSGGVGVLMADDAQGRGLDVAKLPQGTQDKIREMVPFAGTGNPIDATGQVINDKTLLTRILALVLAEGDYGSFICFQGSGGRNPESRERMQQAWSEQRQAHPDTVFAATGFSSDEFTRSMEAIDIMDFEEPTHATRAIAALSHFGGYFAAERQTPRLGPPARDLPGEGAGGKLHEVAVLDLLRDAGLPMVDARLCADADAAANSAAAIGYPVVLKIVSADILHKTEIGGVALNLADAAAVRAAFAQVTARAMAAAPDAEIAGCLVAPMVSGGVEAILGVQNDPVFGPVVMFGLGGIFVEVLEDVTFRAAPFDVAEARRMIREIKAYKILQGVRGQPPGDVEALAQALSDLSLFAAAHGGRIESLDLNPFLVLPMGQGVMALDAVLELR